MSSAPDELKLKISEIFASVQGEGRSAGADAVFLRLAMCNLRCDWCDTRYSWDFANFRYDDEVDELDISAVEAQLTATDSPPGSHLVITGGEPLLQQPALEALLARLDSELFVELETNGTLAPSAAIAPRVNQFNVSPKLDNSKEPERRRLISSSLDALRRTDKAWLKLVVEGEQEHDEIETLVSRFDWPKERVLLMPQAAQRSVLERRAPQVQQLARSLGLGYSPRLHIERWGGRRGV